MKYIGMVIIVLLFAIWVRMGHLIDAYSDNPVSRVWHQQCNYDVKALQGSNVIVKDGE